MTRSNTADKTLKEAKDAAKAASDCLGGDDIKLVRSYVLSTKPGEEKAFEEHTEAVSYRTTLEAYAGVVVGRFLREHPEFQDEDFRYLKPHIEILERYAK